MECQNLVVAGSKWGFGSLPTALKEEVGLEGGFSRLTISSLTGTILEHRQPEMRLLQESMYTLARTHGVRNVFLVSSEHEIHEAARAIGPVLPDGRRVRIVPVHLSPPIKERKKIVCCCSNLCMHGEEGLNRFVDGVFVEAFPGFPGTILRSPQYLDRFLKRIVDQSGDVDEVEIVGHTDCPAYFGYTAEAAEEDVQYLCLTMAKTARKRGFHGAVRGRMAELDPGTDRVVNLRAVCLID